ncbi:MAG TPA: PIN domain-containing protein [Candidatus Dormibacteraeota bacterium]|nr:PIN domain-containing protein [Candidatus Dormibacteraeota bacterium]
MVVLDTNIIIDHLRLQGTQESQLMAIVRQKPKEVLALTTISLQELYEGRSTKDSQKEQYLLATISPLRILPYTYEVAKLAGEIARDLDRTIEFADAAIAATTILNGGSLHTSNKKDFVGIVQLQLLS